LGIFSIRVSFVVVGIFVVLLLLLSAAG